VDYADDITGHDKPNIGLMPTGMVPVRQVGMTQTSDVTQCSPLALGQRTECVVKSISSGVTVDEMSYRHWFDLESWGGTAVFNTTNVLGDTILDIPITLTPTYFFGGLTPTVFSFSAAELLIMQHAFYSFEKLELRIECVRSRVGGGQLHFAPFYTFGPGPMASHEMTFGSIAGFIDLTSERTEYTYILPWMDGVGSLKVPFVPVEPGSEGEFCLGYAKLSVVTPLVVDNLSPGVVYINWYWRAVGPKGHGQGASMESLVYQSPYGDKKKRERVQAG